LDAQAQLEALARELDKTHPGAAVSLREGMAETLTVLRLDLPLGTVAFAAWLRTPAEASPSTSTPSPKAALPGASPPVPGKTQAEGKHDDDGAAYDCAAGPIRPAWRLGPSLG